MTTTPLGSEADELDYWLNAADWLYEMAWRGRIKEKHYVKWAKRLDQIPGAGEYYRELCAMPPLILPTTLRLRKLVPVEPRSKGTQTDPR